MDITPILHAICAVAVQGLVGCITGDWAYGAAIACTFLLPANIPRQNIAGLSVLVMVTDIRCRGGAVLIRTRGMWQA